MFLKVLPPTQQSAAQLDRLRHEFFHPSFKHHYIFITRRQMTETERERDMNQAATPHSVWCLSLRYLIALFKPTFYLSMLEKTQLHKSCKWTFYLTIHNLIGTLDAPQTPSSS